MKLNLKSYLKLGAALLAFLAFFMLFMPAITMTTSSTPLKLEWNEIYLGEFSELNGKPVIVPMIGFILFLIGSLILSYTTVQPSQKEVVVTALPIILIIFGVVFVLLTRVFFNAAMGISGVQDQMEQYSIGIGPILGGVLGIASILLCIVGEYIVGD